MTTSLVLDFPDLNISDNWKGYFLNHLTPEDHPNHDKPHTPPVNVDWKDDLAQGIYLEADKPVDIKFQWAYKKWKLYKNPEDSDRASLPEPIDIVVGLYKYGSFSKLEPKKQDLVLFSYYRPAIGKPIELRPYRTIRNPLKKSGAREEMVKYRRQMAESFIQQRGKEIDIATAGLFQQLGESQATALGLKQLNLSQGIIDFFDAFPNEMFIFLKSGSLKINTAIAEEMAKATPDPKLAWLNENILIGANPDGSLQLVPAGLIIQSTFDDSVTPISQLEINTKAIEVNPIGVLKAILAELEEKAIALNISDEFQNFKYIYLKSPLNLEPIKAIAPLPPEDPNQKNWLFTVLPDSADIIAALTQEEKEYLTLPDEATSISFKDYLLLKIK